MIRKDVFLVLHFLVALMPISSRVHSSELIPLNSSKVPDVMQLDFANGLFEDLTSSELKSIKEELLLLENKIASYSKLNQAYYWYHLALTNHALRLSSEQVIPHLKKAVKLRSFLTKQQEFNILLKGQQLSRTYGHQDLAIAYLDQIKALYPQDYFDSFNLDVAKLNEAYGKIYFSSGDYKIAEQYFSFIIDETEKRGLAPEEEWLKKLGQCQSATQNNSAATDTLKKLYRLYPSKPNEVYLKRHLEKVEKIESFKNKTSHSADT